MSDTAAQPLETATPVAVTPNNQQMNSIASTPKVSSDYEKCREQRIKENLERMQKLGIYDLSLKMKSIKPNTHRKNNKPYKTPNRCISPLPPSVPTRRSSRLQSTPAVSYTEVEVSKKGKDNKEVWIGENYRPEVYTEEQEKLLGDTKMEWTLFVDGYGKDGKKIYDQVRGKTCHQCRQKTLGHRTQCIKCNLVQGQFCGDCLYMRYGENVLEAMKNPDWICPPCRGICNCSLCRQAKGWAPTGILYRKISSLGYKSVAHYLIQTHRADPNSEKNEKETENPVCDKPSLSKEDVEDPKVINVIQLSDRSEGKNVKQESDQASSEHKHPQTEIESEICIATNEEMKDKKQELEHKNTNADLELELKNKDKEADESEGKNVKQESDQAPSEHKNPETEIESESCIATNEEKQELECKNRNAELELELKNKEKEADDEVEIRIVTPETKKKTNKKRCAAMEPAFENSIAGRLRSRRKCT